MCIDRFSPAQVNCLYIIFLYTSSPSAKSYLPCIALRGACFSHQLSLYYSVLGRRYLSPGLCHNFLCLPIPSLSLLIAFLYLARCSTFECVLLSISYWITGAMQKTIWHDVVLKQASLCDAVLPCLL